MKYNFNFELNAWVLLDVEAESLEEARQKLSEMSAEELVQKACVKDYSLVDVTTETTDVTVKVFDIDYDEEALTDKLPSEVTLVIKGVERNNLYTESFKHQIVMALTDYIFTELNSSGDFFDLDYVVLEEK